MSIHEELVTKTLMAKPETGDDYLNIDWESRLITVPESLTNIGVYNDKDTNRIYFRCPIEYGEFRIADFGIHVNYQNTGKSNTKYDGDVYFVDDVESDGDYLTFSWLVGRHAYLEEGTTAFIVCCKVVDSNDDVVNELNTTVAVLDVLEGLEVDVLPPEEYPDYLEEILKRCEAAEQTANEAKEEAQSALEAGVSYYTCDSDADAEEKYVVVVDNNNPGFFVGIQFTKGNTRADEDVYLRFFSGGSAHYTIEGDARCDADGVVFFRINNRTEVAYVDAALTRANTAQDKAEAVEGIADGAQASADSALELVNYVRRDAQSAQSTADSALEKANEIADTAITGVTVNGTAAEVNDHVAEITVDGGSIAYGVCEEDEADNGTKDITGLDSRFSQMDGWTLAVLFPDGNTRQTIKLDDGRTDVSVIGDARCPENSVVFFVYSTTDSAFIVDAALTRANTAQLEAEDAREFANGVGGIAEDAQGKAEAAQKTADAITDSAITAITVNGEDVPVSNNKAEITVSGGSEPTYDADTETLIFS